MQKILMKVAWFGGGVREFEDNVNRELTNGWTVRNLNVVKGGIGLRMVCTAVLEHAEPIAMHSFERESAANFAGRDIR